MSDGQADKKVIIVGHCTPDTFMLQALSMRAQPGVQTVRVNDHAALHAEMADKPVLLVNRVLDGSFEADDGIDLIAKTKAQFGDDHVAILISNLPEAQEAASAVGAFTGFGKSDINSKDSEQIVRDALGQ